MNYKQVITILPLLIEGLVILHYVQSTEGNEYEEYKALDLDGPSGLSV